MSQKTWGGRFDGPADRRVEDFTESVSFDRRLYRHDIRASQAHARMLGEVNLITADDAERLCAALDRIGDRIAAGGMEFTAALEDIHTHIERALIDELGDLGRKLHTGRSRNDQVATDMKLWARDAIDELDGLLADVQRAFVESAERDIDVIIPGYTHLQRAQPVLAAHYYLAYVEKFQRDRDRLQDARRRVNVLPLGMAAMAGTTLPVDRESVREKLGFDSAAGNSLDVSSDRDFLLEFVFALSVTAAHLSGWAEEWIIWATTEFNFLDLPDEFCTGSSIMPHKKNPDVLELIRGKSAGVMARLNHLALLTKGLPLAYNRDLQEDKPPAFAAFDETAAMLSLAAPLVRGTRLRQQSINARLEDGFLDATTLMERLVADGEPMRSAHERVGKLVREAESRRCRLIDLSDDLIAPEVKRALGVQNAVRAFRSHGSTAPARVAEQVKAWRGRLGGGAS